jgi:hypothetical protein
MLWWEAKGTVKELPVLLLSALSLNTSQHPMERRRLQPKALQVRRIVPTLPGSCTPSKITKRLLPVKRASNEGWGGSFSSPAHESGVIVCSPEAFNRKEVGTSVMGAESRDT